MTNIEEYRDENGWISVEDIDIPENVDIDIYDSIYGRATDVRLDCDGFCYDEFGAKYSNITHWKPIDKPINQG